MTLEAFETLNHLMHSRWSCRAFRPDPVPDDVLRTIFRTAQQAPSWNNTQPWHLVVTKGAGTHRFRSLMTSMNQSGAAASPDFEFPREYRDVYMARRRACGFALYDAVGVARGDRAAYARQTARNYELFDAPHVAIVTSDEAIGVYGAVDCGAYVLAFTLAAQAAGVATIAQAALAVYSEAIRTHFVLPDTRRVVCGISFGWPDKAAPVNRYRTDRADISDVVQWADK